MHRWPGLLEVSVLTWLAASQPPHRTIVPQSLLSLLLHAITLGAVLYVSSIPVAAPPAGALDTTLVFLTPAVGGPQVAPPTPAPVRHVVVRLPGAPAVVRAPAAYGFQTIAVPKDIPAGIPQVDIDAPAFDPRDYTGRGVEGGRGAGVPVGGVVGGVVGAPVSGPVAVYEPGTVFIEAQLSEPTQLLSHPPLRYPERMRLAGLSGVVVLQYVVTEEGIADSSSVMVLSAAHDDFVTAARELVLGCRFRPARMGKERVRQLVQQRLVFRIEEAA
jgi:TonB family protein